MRELMAAEYESEDKFLHVIFNAVATMLNERDSHAVGVQIGSYVHAYGPFYDVRSAEKAASVYGGRLMVRTYRTILNAPSKLEPDE